MRIVLVEDNRSLRKGIAYRLEDDGHTVDVLESGEDAELFLKHEDCDLIILDINLPGQSGLDVLASLRARDDPTPVILLTARSRTEDRVIGLDAGADDYLVKPFEMDELAARVRALGRRGDVAPRRVAALGALELDLETFQLKAQTGPLDVPRQELKVLTALVNARGTVVPKSRLLDQVYGVGSETNETVIEVYVSRLRKRLKPHGVRIQVHRGIGYSLAVDAP